MREVGPFILAEQGGKTLGSDAEGIRDGKTNAPGTEIEGKDAFVGHRRL